MINALMKLGIEGMYISLIKSIYAKPMANIIVNGKKLKTFPLNSGQDKGTHSPHSYSTKC
jgi:hypothetical protein